jgi:hypothetical protein
MVLLVLMLVLLALAAMAAPAVALSAAAPFLRAVGAADGSAFGPRDNGTIVIGHEQAIPLNVTTGFEGSFYTRTPDGRYHFLSGGEMAAPDGWDYYETDIHMRFDHCEPPQSPSQAGSPPLLLSVCLASLSPRFRTE